MQPTTTDAARAEGDGLLDDVATRPEGGEQREKFAAAEPDDFALSPRRRTTVARRTLAGATFRKVSDREWVGTMNDLYRWRLEANKTRTKWRAVGLAHVLGRPTRWAATLHEAAQLARWRSRPSRQAGRPHEFELEAPRRRTIGLATSVYDKPRRGRPLAPARLKRPSSPEEEQAALVADVLDDVLNRATAKLRQLHEHERREWRAFHAKMLTNGEQFLAKRNEVCKQALLEAVRPLVARAVAKASRGDRPRRPAR
jgi:hypothetical protein